MTPDSMTPEMAPSNRRWVMAGCQMLGAGLLPPITALLVGPQALTPRLLAGTVLAGVAGAALQLVGVLTDSRREDVKA